jgi:hypothetical protein
MTIPVDELRRVMPVARHPSSGKLLVASLGGWCSTGPLPSGQMVGAMPVARHPSNGKLLVASPSQEHNGAGQVPLHTMVMAQPIARHPSSGKLLVASEPLSCEPPPCDCAPDCTDRATDFPGTLSLTLQYTLPCYPGLGTMTLSATLTGSAATGACLWWSGDETLKSERVWVAPDLMSSGPLGTWDHTFRLSYHCRLRQLEFWPQGFGDYRAFGVGLTACDPYVAEWSSFAVPTCGYNGRNLTWWTQPNVILPGDRVQYGFQIVSITVAE